ncbi:MAG: ATP-binding protein [Chloroflexi bacterium]|nr:ATP-binding protein [Chloroflexota bacterium]MYB84916.1 ATP-binding protein [Chloroflexota bacterium]
MAITDAEVSKINAALGRSFSPNAPIKLPDLLRGRMHEIRRTIEAVETSSMHAVVFGDRGVGKTSIGLVTAAIAQDKSPNGRRALIASCSHDDDFFSIWKTVFEEVLIVQRSIGFASTPVLVQEDRLQLDPDQIQSPNSVRLLVESLPNPTMIIIDEFDRVADETARALMAETIKLFADRGTDTTIVLVGVADDVSELMEAHRSIGRNLAEIQVDPLSQHELSEIVTAGLGGAGMEWAEQVPHDIARLCHGYPSYAHLIGRSAGVAALNGHRDKVEVEDVQSAIDDMLKNSLQSLRNDYERAVASPQPVNLYREVLLACALADKDPRGRFAAADVRGPLRRITHTIDYDIPHFQSHLAKFIDSSRGPILRRSGEPRSYRYRFADPRMIPYVTLQGTNEGLITLRDAQTAHRGPRR